MFAQAKSVVLLTIYNAAVARQTEMAEDAALAEKYAARMPPRKTDPYDRVAGPMLDGFKGSLQALIDDLTVAVSDLSSGILEGMDPPQAKIAMQATLDVFSTVAASVDLYELPVWRASYGDARDIPRFRCGLLRMADMASAQIALVQKKMPVVSQALGKV